LFLDTTENWERSPEGRYLTLNQMMIACAICRRLLRLFSGCDKSPVGFDNAQAFVGRVDSRLAVHKKVPINFALALGDDPDKIISSQVSVFKNRYR